MSVAQRNVDNGPAGSGPAVENGSVGICLEDARTARNQCGASKYDMYEN